MGCDMGVQRKNNKYIVLVRNNIDPSFNSLPSTCPTLLTRPGWIYELKTSKLIQVV